MRIFMTLLFGAALSSAASMVSADQQCQDNQMINWGKSMEPLAHPGDTLTVRPKGCGEISRQDLVIFQHYAYPVPILKWVAGVPGDTLEIDPDTGQLLIEGEALMNPDDEPYRLRGERISMVQYLSGPIPEGWFYLLGTHPQGGDDSTRFGLIPERAIQGVIQKVEAGGGERVTFIDRETLHRETGVPNEVLYRTIGEVIHEGMPQIIVLSQEDAGRFDSYVDATNILRQALFERYWRPNSGHQRQPSSRANETGGGHLPVELDPEAFRPE